ncbi:MAG TPA: membrane protein insertase YidC, partial [Tepidisphaeraceae bacterium]|nr:membrane protein insertase YidC [Tepidisphaeraceae bacterium]
AVGTGIALIAIYYLALWQYDKHFPKQQSQTTPAGVVAAQTQPATEPATEPAVATTTRPALASTQQIVPASAPSVPTLTATAAGAQVVPATQPSVNPVPAILGSARPKDSSFALQLEVQPLGAGLGGVVLNDFKRTAQGDQPYSFESPLPNRLDTEPLGSRSITVNGATYDLAGVQWSLVASSPTSVTYGADLVQNGSPLVHLSKTFTDAPRSQPNLGYEARVEYAFANATDKPMTIKAAFNGPTLPPPEGSRGPDRQVAGGYLIDKNHVEVTFHPIEEFKVDKNNGQIDLTTDGKGQHPVRWAGAVSTYFASVVLPLEMEVDGKPTDNTSYISNVTAQGVDIDAKDVEQRQAYLTFTTTDLKLTPHGSVMLPMAAYFGPKWREKLDSAYYAGFPRQYAQLAVVRTSMCGISFCTFDWLTGPINALLVGMHWLFRDWGLAIIGLVAIVRILLHPITRQSQISMSRMSKMGPEMERLKKKYGDDKDALNKAMVEFHREQGLGPYLGCLPMFLQMPIWIALYGVLQSTFQLRQAPFLWNLTWIHDLSQPDYLIRFTHPIPFLFGAEIRGLNLVPILLAAVMAIQQQFMPKPMAASPEQMKQQKMMQWLSPIMFLFFFYNLPSGLNLYIFTSTAVGIIESKSIRDHLKKKEEAEKAGRVFVETKPTRGSKQARNTQPEPTNKPARGPMGWLGARWAKLLEQAEQVRHNQQRRDGKKRS